VVVRRDASGALGVGFDCAPGDGSVLVSAVAPGGPAARAGLCVGSVMVAIGGVEVAGAGSAFLAKRRLDKAVEAAQQFADVEFVFRAAAPQGSVAHPVHAYAHAAVGGGNGAHLGSHGNRAVHHPEPSFGNFGNAGEQISGAVSTTPPVKKICGCDKGLFAFVVIVAVLVAAGVTVVVVLIATGKLTRARLGV
jgi:hypothetical protein